MPQELKEAFKAKGKKFEALRSPRLIGAITAAGLAALVFAKSPLSRL
jgi:hypothetical protein